MKPLFLFFAVAFAIASSPLLAQDTVRISIGVIEYNADSTEIDVPVFGEFPDGVSGFQFAINYDTSILTFDTLAFSESLPTSFGAIYNVTEEGKIRIIFAPVDPSIPISLGDDGLILNMHFEIEIKQQGIFPIEFGDEIRMKFVDVNGNPIPHVSTNGAVILQPTFTQLELADSVITTGLQQVCLPLKGAYFPTVSSFRFDFEWDDTYINLADIKLDSNPLELVDASFQQSPGYLRIERLGSLTDTIGALPVFTELLQLCFTGNEDPGGSAIQLDQESSFYTIPNDSSVSEATILFPSGGLAFRSDLDNSKVELTVGVTENIPDSETLCVPVLVDEFNQVGDFTLFLRWYLTNTANENLEFVGIANPHPGLEADALSYLAPLNARNARIDYSPSLARGVTLMAGDTLIELCYSVFDSCAVAIITELNSPFTNQFTRYERFSESTYPIPHQINNGGLTFHQGLVRLSLDTVTVSNDNELIELSLRNSREVVPVQGSLVLKFPADSLSLVSVSANTSVNASIFLQDHPDGALVTFRRTNFMEEDMWPEGVWFTFTFSANFEVGAVKVEMTLSEGTNLRIFKSSSSEIVPSALDPGLIVITNPVAVNERQLINGSLYPNPIASGQALNIIAPELAGASVKLHLINITGRTIQTSTIEFDGSGSAGCQFTGQPAGAYILRLSTKTGGMFQQVVLVR